MCPDGHTPQKQGNGKPAAQCPKRRRREPLDRWVATRREVLEVFPDTRVNRQAADNLGAPSGRAVACHSDRSRPSVSDEVLKTAGEPGPHHLLRRQQRQNREQNDAAPSEDAK